MKYEIFLTEVKKGVENHIGKEVRVSINHVMKNNGIELDGLVIMKSNSSISPTIYLNSYYEKYCDGEDLKQIIDGIIKIYNSNCNSLTVQPDFFSDFEQIKSRIVYKVINYKQNQKLLSKVPHKRILDLAIVFYCLLEQNDLGNATILIYDSHLNMWNAELEEVYQLAVINTPRLLQSSIKKMSEIIKEILQNGNQEDLEDSDDLSIDDPEENYPADMFVLTNNSKINGAACMFYENVLDEFAESIKSDLFILPSSIHEVIIIPKVSNISKQDLCNMVKEVNTDGVAQDEVLSDHVYLYNRKEHTITL